MHESIIGRLHSNGSVLRESGSELAREWFSFADKVALLNRNIHAPANAQQDVRQIADIVAVSNNDDLIHDIIYQVIPTLLPRK